MTTIIGVEHNGKVFMGADSEVINGWSRSTLTLPKIFKHRDLLFGVAGELRTVNLLQYQLQVPAAKMKQNNEEYVIVHVINAIRQCLKDNAWVTVENSKEHASSNNLLIGYQGRVYRVGSHFDVALYDTGIASIGSGCEYALGAFYALRVGRKRSYSDQQIKSQVISALKISAQLSMGVSEPFYVESL